MFDSKDMVHVLKLIRLTSGDRPAIVNMPGFFFHR